MSQKVKVSGTWRDANPYVKVGGTWRLPLQVYNKVNGKWYLSFLRGGIVDPTYSTGSGTTNEILKGATQVDGKEILVGNIATWNGVTCGRIIRLNLDGTTDTAFNNAVGTGANGTIFSLAIQSDGKIVLGGNFTSWNGTTVGRVVRLNSDGTRDTAFSTNVGTGANDVVRDHIAIQPDGKIIFVGSFKSWNGVTSNRVVRLNADGTRDTIFGSNTGTSSNGFISGAAVQSNGQIILTGTFTSWNGTTVGRVVRLNSDGTLDTAFSNNVGTGANSNIYSATVQSDGKIILTGFFNLFNGVSSKSIVRLNSNGTVDTSFSANIGTGAGDNVWINTPALQSDGKIVAGGDFTSWNGATVGRVVRLNSDGTLDTAFLTNIGTGATGASSFSPTIYSSYLRLNATVSLCGNFINWNNVPVNCYVRIGGDIAA